MWNRALILSLLVVCSLSSPAATYYVTLAGNDGNAGTQALPWRTVQKAANTAVAGDIVNVSTGNYGEKVVEQSDGTVPGSPVTFQVNATNTGPVNLVSIRATRRYNLWNGFTVAGNSDINNAMVRIDPPGGANDGSWTVLTNCSILQPAFVISTNASFTTNSVTITDGNFTTAGFTTNSLCFWMGASYAFYTNIGTAHTVSFISADGKTMFIQGSVAADAGSNYWFVCAAGVDNSAFKGVYSPLGSGVAASNVVIAACLFSNGFGPAILLSGKNTQVISNEVCFNHGYYFIQNNTGNGKIIGNWFHDNHNIEWFTQDELTGANHPPGGQFFDFQSSLVASFNDADRTNNLMAYNWFQDCDNALAQIEDSTGADTWNVFTNVFVGMMQHASMSMNHTRFRGNTFYRDAYNIDESLLLGLGGVHGSTMDGAEVAYNVFVDNGEHKVLANEFPYTLTTFTNPVLGTNFSVTAETIGWASTPATTGVLTNNGDPLFVSTRNPIVLGTDGKPSAALSGLRPMPNSLIASLGIGALPAAPSTSPIAHFTAKIRVPAWQDKTSTNYDLFWTSQKPENRTNVIRAYNTPENLGQIPCPVDFDGSKSIDGITPLNLYCVNLFYWDFGDGQKMISHLPVVSHMYTTIGTNVVIMAFTNIYGQSSAFTNWYRTVAGTNTNLKYVTKSGNDSTGDGSQGNPWLTIQKAATSASANWVVHVGPGGYPEIVDCPQSAASNQPVLFVGHGSEVVGFNLRSADYMIEGFFANGTNTLLFGSPFYIYDVAHRVTIYNCLTGDYTNKFGFHLHNTSTNFWTAAHDVSITNNHCYKIYGPTMDLHGSNYLALGNFIENTRSEGDAFRAWGVSNRISYNYCTNLSGFGGGGHADFIQSFGDFGESFFNSIIEGNLILGHDSQPITFEHDSSGNSNFGATYTNIFFKNNAWLNQIFAGSIDVDGVKLYNNLFYGLGNFDGIHVFVFGGTRGSAFGTEIINNAFYSTGNNLNTGWYPIPGDGGINNWSLTADYNFLTRSNFTAYTGFPRPTFDTHSISGGDPKFFSIANYDFRINTNSIMIAAGQVVNGVPIDLLKVTRPNPPDIGPYQAFAGAPVSDPNITVQPQNQTVTVGQTATFTVTATGGSTLHYAWTFNGGAVGSDSSSYVRVNCQLVDNGGLVQVTVSDAAGSLPSNTVTLTVNSSGIPSPTNLRIGPGTLSIGPGTLRIGQ